MGTPETSRDRNSRLPRVLFVAGLNPSIKFGSLEEQILVIAKEFRSRGQTFVPVFDSPMVGDAKAHFAAAAATTEHLSLDRLSVGRVRALLAMIRKYRIEAIHWNFYHPFNAYVWVLSILRPGLRHYFTDHTSRASRSDSNSRRKHWLLRRLLFSRFSKIICITDFVRNSLLEAGASPQRSVTTRYFINTDRFRPDQATRDRVREELNAGSEFVALMVAHLIPEKGIDIALRALVLVPDVVAWIVGDGPERSRLEQLARELGLERRVQFIGSQSYVEPFMRGSDCLLCPSLWQEAAGLVNIEALACGVPVLASSVGGIPEIVDHERTGFLLPPGDHEELARALRKLNQSPTLREKMSHSARSEALHRFSVSSRLHDHLNTYSVAVGEE